MKDHITRRKKGMKRVAGKEKKGRRGQQDYPCAISRTKKKGKKKRLLSHIVSTQTARKISKGGHDREREKRTAMTPPWLFVVKKKRKGGKKKTAQSSLRVRRGVTKKGSTGKPL